MIDLPHDHSIVGMVLSCPARTVHADGGFDDARLQEAVGVGIGAGSHDLDTFEGMMVAHANVGWASFRDGAWTTSTMTAEEWIAEEWIAEASSEVDPILYTELVDDWTVHVDVGHLAFVRADAVLRIAGRPERHNIDDFTLIKQDGVWKFLTLSYLGRPAPTPGTFSGAPASGSSTRR